MERNVILKYLRGETSPEERIKMLRWLEEDPAHLEEYKYLRRIFDAILMQRREYTPIYSFVTLHQPENMDASSGQPWRLSVFCRQEHGYTHSIFPKTRQNC